ncbi:TolB family protein [Streptomyces sp. NBC_01190]|uniref:TolB family protein n=1 Tax=Streptomyces sp. NBC_01190 TaxID=2903767 RepID=UPI0038702477|nr:TolB-like translocation protein [Streptomyces sp. NBC_01190]
MTVRNKLLVLVACVTVLACVAGAAVWRATDRADRRNQVQAGGPAIHAGPVTLGPKGTSAPTGVTGGNGAAGAAPSASGRRIVFRSLAWGPHRDELASVAAADPEGPRTASGVKCLRFYAAGGTGICLQAERGPVTDTYQALVLDSRLHETRHVGLAGIPTRARVSPSGRMVAWTVFVGGDSYAGTNFSTRASILDTRTGVLQPTLEDYTVIRDGKRIRAADFNFWGVTFADDEHFYATLGTAGHTYLIRGDVATRTATTLRTNVECPSLSPDGTRIAFKKRVPGLSPDAPWRLYVLDLATLKDHPTAETRNVDDQAVWSDDDTLVYSLPGDYGSDLYTVPASGAGSARLLMRSALAPAYLG